jgi:hypothetical protein
MYLVKPKDYVHPICRAHNMASRQAMCDFLEQYATITYYLDATALEFAHRLIKWQEDNHILIGWLDGPGHYYFYNEADMHLFLLTNDDFERVNQ